MSYSTVLTSLDILEEPTGVNVLDSFRLLVVLFFLPGLDTVPYTSKNILPFPDPTESLGTLVHLNSKQNSCSTLRVLSRWCSCSRLQLDLIF